jgi:signal transduction histidine kinase/CheY-like chemotaxis protein
MDVNNDDLLNDGEGDPSRANFQAWFEQAPGLYLVLDSELDIVGATDAYLSATLTKREDILTRNLFEVFPDNPNDDDATGVSNLRASLQRVINTCAPDSMGVQKYDIPIPGSNDGAFETRYWSPRNFPIIDRSGRLINIIHQVEDVTEFMQMRETESRQHLLTDQLQSKAEQMETDIVKRSQELQATNAALREASAAKSDFLSRMSHELRTPFTAVLGFGELLSMTDLDEEQTEYIKNVLSAARHLLELLDDVLDISRIESGHLSLSVEPVAIAPLLGDTLNLIRPLAASHKIRIVEELVDINHLYISADRQRLRQILINLMSNAIKYNSKMGSVTLSIENVSDERLRISVTDTGRGISAEGIRKLFTPFERLDATSTSIEGTGLGLALSQQLAEAMGGSIGVESTVGKGSRFWVDLQKVEPLVLEMLPQQTPAVDIRDYASTRQVLYVEDTVANVRLIEQILKRRPGIELIPAMTGGIALDMARQHKPDLVLLDLHLPDIGGEEVLQRLKDDEATCDIPVVILSADATRRQMDALIADGALTYLTKPIGVRALLKIVDELFSDVSV